jgi:hypothetical protein
VTIPPDFVFSKGNLQDYAECPRLFELRHLRHILWPAIQSQPVLESERARMEGKQFHRLIHQSLLGIPDKDLEAIAKGEDLRRWWSNFRSSMSASLKGDCFPEFTLTIPFESWQLVAIYDLIVVSPSGSLHFYDWKTSRQRPKKLWVLEWLQTRVYPYLLVKAGGFLAPSHSIDPQNVEMTYWFAEQPQMPETILYSTQKFQKDEEYLSHLIREIDAREPGQFPLTHRDRRCSYCEYRSLCDKGVAAGELDDTDEGDRDEDLVTGSWIDQMDEIAF